MKQTLYAHSFCSESAEIEQRYINFDCSLPVDFFKSDKLVLLDTSDSQPIMIIKDQDQEYIFCYVLQEVYDELNIITLNYRLSMESLKEFSDKGYSLNNMIKSGDLITSSLRLFKSNGRLFCAIITTLGYGSTGFIMFSLTKGNRKSHEQSVMIRYKEALLLSEEYNLPKELVNYIFFTGLSEKLWHIDYLSHMEMMSIYKDRYHK